MLEYDDVGFEYSKELSDLLSKLINKKRAERLGANSGASEIQNHPWFKDIDFIKLLNK